VVYTGCYAPNSYADGARIIGEATENWSPTAYGTKLDFHTTPSGTTTMSPAATLDGAGNLQIYGITATKPGSTAWVNPSEARLKEAMAPYHAGLEEVCRLAPISYRYSGSHDMPTGTTFYGLDAEATAQVMPEMVCKVQHSWGQQNNRRNEELLAVDAGPLIYALINCVKELSARIQVLEAVAR
jgi:hypothetical protein